MISELLFHTTTLLPISFLLLEEVEWGFLLLWACVWDS